MIVYELCLLLRVMPKPELASTLKRTAQAIFEKGGVIRKLENMGTRPMPYRTSVHGVTYNRASYYLMEFNAPPEAIEDLKEEYARDVDIIRRRIYKKVEPDNEKCTLHEELQPAPYRKDVQQLVAQSKKLEKPKYDYRTGLDYYPFQK